MKYILTIYLTQIQIYSKLYYIILYNSKYIDFKYFNIFLKFVIHFKLRAHQFR